MKGILWFPNAGKERISDLESSPPSSVYLLLTAEGPAWPVPWAPAASLVCPQPSNCFQCWTKASFSTPASRGWVRGACDEQPLCSLGVCFRHSHSGDASRIHHHHHHQRRRGHSSPLSSQNTHGPLDESSHAFPSRPVKGIGRGSTCQAMRVSLLLPPGQWVPVNLKPSHLGVRGVFSKKFPVPAQPKWQAFDFFTATS